mgnify:CR=1 FL=1
MNPSYAIVAARSRNHVIGRGSDIPWQVKGEQALFKKITDGGCLVMGRKTFESIGKPLVNRTNRVITSQKGWSHEGIEVYHNLTDAISFAKKTASLTKVDEIFIIGGSSVYKKSISHAHKVYLTEIHKAYNGDVWFEDLDNKEWKEISSESFLSEDKNKPPFSFKIFHRINSFTY